MEKLHQEITLEIFSRLPVESVLQSKLVCKTWRTLLQLPYFVDLHLRRLQLDWDDGDDGGSGGAKMDLRGLFFRIRESNSEVRHYYGGVDIIHNNHRYFYERLIRLSHPFVEYLYPWQTDVVGAMVGSCNGLICFSVLDDDIDDPVYILNPITREYVYLPRFTETYTGFVHIMSGFGFHPSTNEYKVVRMTYYCCNQQRPHVQVYTLGSRKGWRDIGSIACAINCTRPQGILSNGALHWLDYRKWNVVAFDLADEKFRLLPLPPCGPGPKCSFNELRDLGRSLCFVHRVGQHQNLDIWSLQGKKDQDHYSWTWTKKCSIKCEGLYYLPFAVTKAGKVLLYNKTLCLYDPKSGTMTKLVGDGKQFLEAIPHTNSFVSLKALGEKSRRIRGRCKDGQISWTTC